MGATSFASVKLPVDLVQQAREAAQPSRRSVAAQIEYWATLGRIAETSGLTTLEAREAIAHYDLRQAQTLDTLADIEQAFVAADANGRLAQAVRHVVLHNRRQAG